MNPLVAVSVVMGFNKLYPFVLFLASSDIHHKHNPLLTETHSGTSLFCVITDHLCNTFSNSGSLFDVTQTYFTLLLPIIGSFRRL